MGQSPMNAETSKHFYLPKRIEIHTAVCDTQGSRLPFGGRGHGGLAPHGGGGGV